MFIPVLGSFKQYYSFLFCFFFVTCESYFFLVIILIYVRVFKCCSISSDAGLSSLYRFDSVSNSWLARDGTALLKLPDCVWSLCVHAFHRIIFTLLIWVPILLFYFFKTKIGKTASISLNSSLCFSVVKYSTITFYCHRYYSIVLSSSLYKFQLSLKELPYVFLFYSIQHSFDFFSLEGSLHMTAKQNNAVLLFFTQSTTMMALHC